MNLAHDIFDIWLTHLVDVTNDKMMLIKSPVLTCPDGLSIWFEN